MGEVTDEEFTSVTHMPTPTRKVLLLHGYAQNSIVFNRKVGRDRDDAGEFWLISGFCKISAIKKQCAKDVEFGQSVALICPRSKYW